MRVNGVVVLHPAIDECESGGGIGDRVPPNVIALEGLHKRLGHPRALGAFDRRETRHEIARAISMVLWAAKIDPLSESHCTGCGARIAPERFSTQLTIMLRIISPETPARAGART